MHFRITETTAQLLNDLNRLGGEIEPRLDQVSAAARGEWRELRSRLPTAQDLQNGWSSVSDEDLAVMHAKVLRFRDLLGTRRPASPRSGATVIAIGSIFRS
ncbi:MAG TPA: hypothetical protein VFH68_04075 [Polyangia bacterium]|jgi:ElaB/YqjD/DUF883 family membrane-anchored ribosome-binding protein|nr:hypothetical protein [Polyangia bacterium]